MSKSFNFETKTHSLSAYIHQIFMIFHENSFASFIYGSPVYESLHQNMFAQSRLQRVNEMSRILGRFRIKLFGRLYLICLVVILTENANLCQKHVFELTKNLKTENLIISRKGRSLL